MNHLDEKYFTDFKYIAKNRLDNGGMYVFNIGTLIYSVIMIGIPYLVMKTWGTIGWEQLTPFLQNVFKMEGILITLQLFILLFCFKVNNVNQRILSISIVVYAYKMTIDPFVALAYNTMDSGVYDIVKYYLAAILILGLLIHFVFLYHWIRKIKKGKYSTSIRIESQTKRKKNFLLFSAIFILVVFSFLLMRSFNNYNDIILLLVALVILISIAYAVCEFIIVAYCIFRFPSFAVNPSPQKKSQYVNPKNRRKKKKRKKK